MIIHHSNKQGGFRGTTAIRDAVDEVWALRKLSDEEQKLEIEAGSDDPTRTRLVTVEKSRQGREQSHLWLHKNQDETFTLEERAKPLQAIQGLCPRRQGFGILRESGEVTRSRRSTMLFTVVCFARSLNQG